MPCKGCGKKVSEIEGNFKMRFIGKTPDGKLMKGAPGNYKAGEIKMMPFRHSKYKWWELVEPLPELVVPPPSEGDSAYEEAYYVSWEEETTGDVDERLEWNTSATGILGDDKASVESMKDYRESLSKVEELEVLKEEPEESENDEYVYTREELVKRLDEAGIEYNPKAWTSTLQAMVEKLESEEES